jgi:pimeloyl-ACP methyl ester carboxylesterase
MAEISPALYRAGEGEPLVLLHGFTGAWRHWLPVLAELVPRFEVIAPTLHGHDGGPALPPGGGSHTISEGADHAEQLLDSLGIDTAHFAGNSMGGALSLELAKRGRARSVVAISPGGGWRADDKTEALRIVRWFARNQRLARAALPRAGQIMRRPGARRLALRDVMTRGDQMPVREAVQLIRSSTRCTVVGDVLDTIKSGNALLTDLGKIDVPVLVTWGDCDRILPMDRHSQRFRDEIPGVEFRVTPGLGHTPMWDDPALISSTIADWASAASKWPVAGGTVAAAAGATTD